MEWAVNASVIHIGQSLAPTESCKDDLLLAADSVTPPCLSAFVPEGGHPLLNGPMA